MENELDFRAVLRECSEPAVGVAVLSALTQLFERDRQLLQLNVKEQAIAFHFSAYLKPLFPDLDVDFEYSLMGDGPKTVTYNESPQRVFPDVVVHRRHTGLNVLAIEIKKDRNPEPNERDISKLNAYRRELGYRHALFLRLGTGASAGHVTDCVWVDG